MAKIKGVPVSLVWLELVEDVVGAAIALSLKMADPATGKGLVGDGGS